METEKKDTEKVRKVERERNDKNRERKIHEWMKY